MNESRKSKIEEIRSKSLETLRDARLAEQEKLRLESRFKLNEAAGSAAGAAGGAAGGGSGDRLAPVAPILDAVLKHYIQDNAPRTYSADLTTNNLQAGPYLTDWYGPSLMCQPIGLSSFKLDSKISNLDISGAVLSSKGGSAEVTVSGGKGFGAMVEITVSQLAPDNLNQTVDAVVKSAGRLYEANDVLELYGNGEVFSGKMTFIANTNSGLGLENDRNFTDQIGADATRSRVEDGAVVLRMLRDKRLKLEDEYRLEAAKLERGLNRAESFENGLEGGPTVENLSLLEAFELTLTPGRTILINNPNNQNAIAGLGGDTPGSYTKGYTPSCGNIDSWGLDGYSGSWKPKADPLPNAGDSLAAMEAQLEELKKSLSESGGDPQSVSNFDTAAYSGIAWPALENAPSQYGDIILVLDSPLPDAGAKYEGDSNLWTWVPLYEFTTKEGNTYKRPGQWTLLNSVPEKTSLVEWGGESVEFTYSLRQLWEAIDTPQEGNPGLGYGGRYWEAFNKALNEVKLADNPQRSATVLCYLPYEESFAGTKLQRPPVAEESK